VTMTPASTTMIARRKRALAATAIAAALVQHVHGGYGKNHPVDEGSGAFSSCRFGASVIGIVVGCCIVHWDE